MRKRVAIVVLAGFLAGCSHVRSFTMPPENNLISGAGSLFAQDGKAVKFETLDLKKLLTEYELDDLSVVSNNAEGETGRYVYLRNELQDRIIASSNQRCGSYIREIVSAKSQTQMGWGALSLLLSGAASISTPIKSAQALAAGGAAATGLNSLYSESYFNNLTVNVISSGITKRREDILEKIMKQRQGSLRMYPVNRAVSDAIYYHSSCNIVTGLETAAHALKATPVPQIVPPASGSTASGNTATENAAPGTPSGTPP